MKYYRITITLQGNEMLYPKNYQSEIGNFVKDYLYYDDEVTALPCLVIALRDEDAKNIVRPGVEEITAEEMKAISDKYEKRYEGFNDQAKIKRIELKLNLLNLKVARNQEILPEEELTSEELAALDPNSDVPGITFKQTLRDKVESHEKRELLKEKKK